MYKLVSIEDNVKKFNVELNTFIEQGWEVFGDLKVVVRANKSVYSILLFKNVVS